MHACSAPHQQHSYEPSIKATSALGRASHSHSFKKISQNPWPQAWSTFVTNTKNMKTTKHIEPTIPLAEYLGVSPNQEESNPCTNIIYSSMASTSDIRKTCSGQTVKSFYSLPEFITTSLSSTTMIQTPSFQYH